MFDRAREDLLEQARFASASEGMNTAIGRGPRGVGAEPQIVGSAQKPSWPQRSPAAGARSAAIASASHRGPGRAGAGVTKDAKKRQQPSSSSSSSPSRPQRPGDSSSPGGRHGSTSKADAARLKVQQQRRQQAGQATRRANSLASQRMAQLQMSEEELERRVESLTPFATLVQRPGSPGVAQGGTGGGEDSEADEEEEEEAGSTSSGSSRTSGGGGRGRGAKRTAAYSLLQRHSEVFGLALDLELREEWQESEERLRSWTKARLQSEGLAVFGLSATLDGSLFRDAILRLYVPSRPLPFHQLSQGDIVLLSREGGGGGNGAGDEGDAGGRRGGARRRSSSSSSSVPGPSPMDNATAMEGVLLDYSTRWMRVAVPSHLAGGVQGGGWRVDLFANAVTYERCAQALRQFSLGPADQADAPSGSGADGSGGKRDSTSAAGMQDVWRILAGAVPTKEDSPLVREEGLSGAEVLARGLPGWARGQQGAGRLRAARRAAADLASASSEATADAPALAGGAAVDPGAGGSGGVGGLNASQVEAVQAALGRTLTLWQGPPGTGKTRTLLRFIKAALAGLPAGRQVLASAASNVAVDNLVAGLLALGVDVVRVGQPAKVSPALLHTTLEARVEQTGKGQLAASLRQQAAGLAGQEAWGLVTQALDLEEQAAQEILGRCQVVACTCVSAGDPRLVSKGRSFPVLVVDEATQATEPAALVAIMAKAESLLLVGDPQQLPPTVKSLHAQRLGLDVPLFQRLQGQGLTPWLLDTQYRMHPSICDFPSAAFYGGRLKSHPTPQDRPAPPGFPWPAPQVPVCFVPVVDGGELRTLGDAQQQQARAARQERPAPRLLPGGSREGQWSGAEGSEEDEEGAGCSFYNPAEAAQVMAVLQGLRERGGLPQGAADVGVITPYNGQVRYLQRLAQEAAAKAAGPNRSRGGGTKPGGGAHSEQGGGSVVRRWEWERLEIQSVDGFQGREKEVIVFSAVRSNAQAAVGFLSDHRRLNVAITRARRGLVVIGDPKTLRRDPIWRAWLEWSRKRGLWMEGPLVPVQRRETAPPAASA